MFSFILLMGIWTWTPGDDWYPGWCGRVKMAPSALHRSFPPLLSRTYRKWALSLAGSEISQPCLLLVCHATLNLATCLIHHVRKVRALWEPDSGKPSGLWWIDKNSTLNFTGPKTNHPITARFAPVTSSHTLGRATEIWNFYFTCHLIYTADIPNCRN